MQILRVGLLALCSFAALYSLAGALNQMITGHSVAPVVAPTALYVTDSRSGNRDLILENHGINAVLFGLAPVWFFVRRSRLRSRNAHQSDVPPQTEAPRNVFSKNRPFVVESILNLLRERDRAGEVAALASTDEQRTLRFHVPAVAYRVLNAAWRIAVLALLAQLVWVQKEQIRETQMLESTIQSVGATVTDTVTDAADDIHEIRRSAETLEIELVN